MNGHQPLIDMRRAGMKPRAVYVSDGPQYQSLDSRWTDPIYGSDFAHVRIDAQDIPEALDLRFVVGMTVVVDAYGSEDRAQRIHEAFIAAKPKALATNTTLKTLIHHG